MLQVNRVCKRDSFTNELYEKDHFIFVFLLSILRYPDHFKNLVVPSQT